MMTRRWGKPQTLQGRLIRSVGAQAGWRVASIPVSLVNVAVVTRELSTAGYGQLTTAFAVYGIFSIIADFGVNAVVIRLASAGDQSLHRLVNTSIGLSLIYAFPGGVALVVFGFLVYSGPEFSLLRGSLAVYAIGFVAACVGASLRPLFQQELRLSCTSAAEFAIAVFCLIGYCASARFSFQPVWYFYVQGISPVVGFGSLLLARRQFRFRPIFDKLLISALFRASLPIGMASLMASLYLRADTFLLTILAPQEVVGEYGLAYRVVGPISVISVYMAATLYPQLAQFNSQDSARYKEVFTRSILGVLTVGTVLSICGCLVARDLILLVSGQRFVGAAVPLRILSISLLPSFVNGVMGGVLVLMNRGRLLLAISTTCLTVNMGLNLLVIPVYGGAGAASVQVLSELVAAGVGLAAVSHDLELFRLLRGVRILIGAVLCMLAANFLASLALGDTGSVIVRVIFLTLASCGAFCSSAYLLGISRYLKS